MVPNKALGIKKLNASKLSAEFKTLSGVSGVVTLEAFVLWHAKLQCPSVFSDGIAASAGKKKKGKKMQAKVRINDCPDCIASVWILDIG